MTTAVSWNARPIKTREQIEDDAWFRGYFPSTERQWDGKTWLRNYPELRLRDLALFCLGDVKDKDVLDVACGGGLYLTVLAKMGARVSGQDISETAITNARDTLNRFQLNGTVKTGDATRLLFPDAAFDAVFSGDFVEHITLEQKREFLREVFRILRPGGVFVVKTPNLAYLRCSLLIKRAFGLLKGRSPFSMHIPHTRNNPDNEHHGLIAYPALKTLLLEQLFHQPSMTRQTLSRPGIPRVLQELLPRLPGLGQMFNEHLIVTVRKPIFYGYFP